MRRNSSSPSPPKPKTAAATNNNNNNNNINNNTAAATSSVTAVVGGWAQTAGMAVSQWTAKKYALPDKTVASQILMYRQLLHTSCRVGLKLSRPYQATPAQISVRHMPWWEKPTAVVHNADGTTTTVTLSMEEMGKMVISYDNLIQRLWQTGTAGCHNHHHRHHHPQHNENAPSLSSPPPPPPIPHEDWVRQLGFQQPDPVTDFRSGGVLSLAMMVWIVESCPMVYQRFVHPESPASVLPFAITSINVTDMMAKFLMLSKSTDRMDALLSQKPFWNMFSDPNALLACQELALDMLADVVQELVDVRSATTTTSSETAKVTVFDFSHILSVTERRVEYDLLGAGPVTVKELRHVHAKLCLKYQQQLRHKLQRIQQQQQQAQQNEVASATVAPQPVNQTPPPQPSPPLESSETNNNNNPKLLHEHILKHASGIGAVATGLAGNVFSKLKMTPTNNNNSVRRQPQLPQPTTAVPSSTTTTAAGAVDFFLEPSDIDAAVAAADDLLRNHNNNDDNDWVGAHQGNDDYDIQIAVAGSERVSRNFRIGDDEDDDDDDALLL